MAPHDQPLKPQPVEKFTCSSITASIWKNEGEKGTFYNVTITRSYKTADGWKHSDFVQPERSGSGHGRPRPRESVDHGAGRDVTGLRTPSALAPRASLHLMKGDP